MKHVLSYLKPHTWALTRTMIVKFMGSMMDLFIPFILAIIIDDVVPQRQPHLVYLWGGGMALCAGLSVTFNIMANRMAAVTSGKVTLKLRHDLFKKLGELSMAQFDSISLSSAVSRLTTDTYNINQFLNRTQRIGVRAPILLIGGLILTSILDAPDAGAGADAAVIALIVFVVTKIRAAIRQAAAGAGQHGARDAGEHRGRARHQGAGQNAHEQQRFDDVNKNLAEVGRKAGSVVAASNPLSSLTLNLGLAVVVLVGAYTVNSGLSRPGSIIAFLNYFTIISGAMMGITRIFIMSSRGIASARRIEEVLQMEADQPQLPAHKQQTPWHIAFEDVSFSYNGVENNISNITFRLKQGQTLGIIGATGSGKTTLTNLLLRLYDVTSGTIYIDGQDIRSLDPVTLSDQTGIAFQSDFIMAATIRDNVAYFRDISDEDIWQALRTAQAEEFVRATADGLLHQVESRGNNLSGGQKQRLLIARALANKPRLLILDDASSALDYRTDAALRRDLSQQHQNTTSIIIAQRVSSIKGADQILVLEDGRAIGQGTHDELMRTCDTYRDIAQVQMGARQADVPEQEVG